MHGIKAALPLPVPGMIDEIEGTMQQAPQKSLHLNSFIDSGIMPAYTPPGMRSF